VYNYDDTFAFNEGATNWVLRVAGYGITMRANVPGRMGPQQHTFTFESASKSQVQNTAYGDLALDDAIHFTRAVLIGADKKMYAACTPWISTGNSLTFTCDDTKLPDAAIPYTIDPVLSTGPNWTDGASVTISDQYHNPNGDYYTDDYGAWNATFSISSIPSNATVSSVTVNDDGIWVDAIATSGEAACFGGPPGSWSLASGSQSLSQIPGQSTLYYSFGLEMGWYMDGTPYSCSFTITGISSLSLTIDYTVPQPLSITTASLPSGAVGAGYSTTLAASGGSGSYSWSVYSGSLPAGLSLSSGGAVSGTPTSSGAPTFTLEVEDTNSNTATAQFTLTISADTTITAHSYSTGTTVTGIMIALDGWPSGGSTCTTPCTLADGLAHSVRMPSPEALPQGGTGTESVFASWSDGGANPHTIQPGASVTANFTAYYEFTGVANPSAGGSVVTGTLNSQGVVVPSGVSANGWYPAGTSFWVTGQPSQGYLFAALSSGGTQLDVVMNTAVTVTGTFGNSVITLQSPSTVVVTKGGRATARFGVASGDDEGLETGCNTNDPYVFGTIDGVSGSGITFGIQGVEQTNGTDQPPWMVCPCAEGYCAVPPPPVEVIQPTTISYNGNPIAASDGSASCSSSTCWVVIGQQVTLTGYPAGGAWTIGGTAYNQWAQNGQQPTSISASSSNPVSFFWATGGSFTAAYSTTLAVANATFTVGAPLITAFDAQPTAPYISPKGWLTAAVTAGPVGISNPVSPQGNVIQGYGTWLQVITTAATELSGPNVLTTTCSPTGNSPWLDGGYPSSAGTTGVAPIYFSDTPGVSLPGYQALGYTAVTEQVGFYLYLLWQPVIQSPSTPVPIEVATWYVNDGASLDGTWQETGSTTVSSQSPTSSYPTWTGVAQSGPSVCSALIW
jgi:hypothetical protein